MARLAGVTLVAIALLVCSASAQNQPPSDPHAVTFAAQSIAALTGGTPISDVTLYKRRLTTKGTKVHEGKPN